MPQQHETSAETRRDSEALEHLETLTHQNLQIIDLLRALLLQGTGRRYPELNAFIAQQAFMARNHPEYGVEAQRDAEGELHG